MSLILGISAGHGAINPDLGWKDPGACNGKYTEHDVAMGIVKEVCHLLDGKIKYHIPKSNWDTSVEYRECVSKGCNYYINIHLNSAENKEASYVEGYYNNEKSLIWARELVVACTKFFPSHGVHHDYMVYGQKNATIPYAFLELGFISNPRDLNILLNKKREVAIAIVEVIERFSGVKVSKTIKLAMQGAEKDYAIVDGKKVDMPLHLVQIKGRNMIDLRFIVEQLGGTIEWDPISKTITVIK
jgi:N-acetylmuramoyl-L-alanine amidase